MERNHLYNFGRGHHGNHLVKSFSIWTSGSGRDVIYKKKFMDVYGQRPITIAHHEPLTQVSDQKHVGIHKLLYDIPPF